MAIGATRIRIRVRAIPIHVIAIEVRVTAMGIRAGWIRVRVAWISIRSREIRRAACPLWILVMWISIQVAPIPIAETQIGGRTGRIEIGMTRTASGLTGIYAEAMWIPSAASPLAGTGVHLKSPLAPTPSCAVP